MPVFPSHQLGGLELGNDRPGVAAPGPILEAVVFDLDGVLTDTASLHQAAWQRLFDEVFEGHSGAAPFTESDYLRYVDGRRRTDGVLAVLASRGITLPAGDPDDSPDGQTLAGLAARKDDYYLRLLHDRGPRAFASSTALVRMLRRQGVATAVVSGSRHCAQVLSAAGLTQLFDVQVDGVDAGRLNLPGKPDPATFLEAARRLRVPPARAAVVEDAVAGVEAGARGGFALVIGVDRRANSEPLARAGASSVVGDLAALAVEPAGPGRARLVRAASPPIRSAPPVEATQGWVWSYDGLDAAREGVREALCTLGNGYFATRGAAPEARQDDTQPQLREHDAAFHHLAPVSIEQAGVASPVGRDASPGEVGDQFAAYSEANVLLLEQLATKPTACHVAQRAWLCHQPIRVQLDGRCEHVRIDRAHRAMSGSLQSAASKCDRTGCQRAAEP
jgi:beta-phosphoglucomutase family hydrolase